MRKSITSIIIFCIAILNAECQTVNFSMDSLAKRLTEILKDYNESVVYVDTSDYATDYPYALDENLMIASSRGLCDEIVRFYIKGADINTTSNEKATPLHYAVESGKKDAAETLLILGAKPDVQDINGNTPLMIATYNNYPQIAELLIRYGADAGISDNLNITPLHIAVMKNDFNDADMLIYYKADPDKTDREGNTPLMLAVYNGSYDIADNLLQAGANPDIPDKKGFTPFMVAAQNGDTLMLSILYKAGADIYRINSEGYDALTIAIKEGRKEAINYLLSIGNMWLEPATDKVKIADVATKNLIEKTDLKKTGVKAGYSKELPVNEVRFAGNISMTNHLYMLSGEIIFRNDYIRGGFMASYDFTPVSSKVLVKEEGSFYQYRLKVRTIEAGFYKELTGNNSSGTKVITPYFSLSAAYKLFSKYNGTGFKPDNKFCIVPCLGCDVNYKYGSVGAGIKYMRTPFYNMSPLWLNLKCSINLFSDKSFFRGKKINIYGRYE